MTLTNVDPICVVIGRSRHQTALAEVQEAARQGARLIEFRLDQLRRPPDVKRILAEKPCPLVATVRRPVDGGRWSGDENARRTLLRQAIVDGFDWVDLETDIADSIPRYKDVKRIVSYHNMKDMPRDLEKIHERMCAQNADVVKLAVRAKHPSDNVRVLELMRKPAKPTVAFCLGEMGLPSRILGAKYGAPFTYAAFNKERILAPGMPTFAELRQVYRYHEINADTQVFGVLGDPVGHSLGRFVHNLVLHRLGINAVYLPFLVPTDDLADALKAFDRVPVQGYSVTIPHKEAVAALAARKDPAVERTHAANTLVRGADGFSASNTDYQGVVETLAANLPALLAAAAQEASSAPTEGEKQSAAPAEAEKPSGLLHSKVVLVLGAGGIARAVAHALHQQGALVTISNRTAERAQKLANEVGCRFVDWKTRHTILCDMVVNCTSVGMSPEVDEMPLHHSFLKPGLVVFDTVYTPENTLLIKEARSRGCQVLTGVDLFVRQAALQFHLFTGREPPLELMRRVVKRVLSPVTIRSEEEEKASLRSEEQAPEENKG